MALLFSFMHRGGGNSRVERPDASCVGNGGFHLPSELVSDASRWKQVTFPIFNLL